MVLWFACWSNAPFQNVGPERRQSVIVMTTDHAKTRLRETSETSCIRNIKLLETVNVQYDTGINVITPAPIICGTHTHCLRFISILSFPLLLCFQNGHFSFSFPTRILRRLHVYFHIDATCSTCLSVNLVALIRCDEEWPTNCNCSSNFLFSLVTSSNNFFSTFSHCMFLYDKWGSCRRM